MTPRLNYIGIVTSDMARALGFYRLLGLEFPDGSDGAPHVEYDLGNFKIAWDTEEVIKSFDTSWTPPTPGQRIGIAFECDNAAEVDSVYQQVIDAGYHGELPPWDAVWGQRYSSVQDPDGNSVDLYAALPSEVTQPE